MGLTKTQSGGLADDSVNDDKLANSIVSAIAANTAKDLTALSASNLTSGTVPDARFPATLPAKSAANLTNIPAANITGTLPAISGANLTNLPASGKAHNIVINGAMQVAQRGTSSTTSGFGSVDRFRCSFSAVSENPTQSQVDVSSGTTPYTLGFRKAFKIQNGNQTTTYGNSNIRLMYRVESQDVANSGWNYLSSSSYVTLSFWIKASVSQNYYGFLLNEDTTQNVYPFETGTLTANTWTKITKTIPGNSNLTFNNDTGAGLRISVYGYLGTDLTSSSMSLNSWTTYDGSNFTPDNTSTWFTTNDATLEFSGFQLEVGDSATDFEHLSYGDTLAKCQRYYYKYPYTFYGFFGYGTNSGTNQMGNLIRPVDMRATPTITMTAGGYWSSGPYGGGGGGYYSYAYGQTTSSNGPNLSNYELDAEI